MVYKKEASFSLMEPSYPVEGCFYTIYIFFFSSCFINILNKKGQLSIVHRFFCVAPITSHVSSYIFDMYKAHYLINCLTS